MSARVGNRIRESTEAAYLASCRLAAPLIRLPASSRRSLARFARLGDGSYECLFMATSAKRKRFNR